ncbi:MAG: type toxin-antitoxin system HicB family antitoxin [Proteobacteria bacterium]|nr:type toxin-antitoxin system HicB family antitoxin [Pseudomonadota bacterium]
MTTKLNFTVDFEDGVFVARCLELDIATDGLTKDEAVANLREALDCYFANPDERLDRQLGADADED